MLSSQITELAFRAAVNTGSRNVTSDSSGISDSIEQSATNRASTLLQANFSGSKLPAESIAQMALITTAVGALKLAYDATIEQISDMKQSRLAFDKERIAGTASFCIPTQMESTTFSKEEKVIQSFINFTNAEAKGNSVPNYIKSYLGIHSGALSENHYQYYSVIPFYKMSMQIAQPVASKKPIDAQRTMISLFFKASLAEVIQKIDVDFQMDWRISSFVSSAYHGPNYLNNRRAPRFIMMCLGNLLWNLQHPVDLKSGFPLTTDETLEVCRQAEDFLNDLLDSKKPTYIGDISDETNGLLSITRQVEVKVKALQAAYVYEQLYELNIEAINNTGHRALRLMDQSLLKLIYKVFNPTIGKDEPNEMAADSIAHTIGYLNQLIHRNQDKSILKLFDQYRPLVKSNTGFNTHPLNVQSIQIQTLTVIDVIIIFCHMRPKDRKELLTSLNSLNLDSSKEFARVLNDLYLKYIKRIKHFAQQELECSLWNAKEDEVAIITARRIIPIITLVLADYRIDVDMDWAYIDLHIYSELPGTTTDLKNSYIFLENSDFIFYINLKGNIEQIQVTDIAMFTNVLNEINPSKQSQVSLTKKNVFDLITALTGHTPDFINPDVLDGNQQVQLINSEASRGGGNYFWNLAPLLLNQNYSEESGKQFNQLPIHQYRLSQMTQIMDHIMGLITEYRHFLQEPKFQKFLIYTLTKIKLEYKAIDQHLDNVDEILAEDETINRSLKAILRPLLKSLEQSIEGFTKSVDHFQKVISAPDFLKKQRQILVGKLKEIYKQYVEVFGSDEHVRLICNTIESEQETSSSFMYRSLIQPRVSQASNLSSIPFVSPKSSSENSLSNTIKIRSSSEPIERNNEASLEQMSALKELAKRSYHAMSYLSRWRSKGWELYFFINHMNENKPVDGNAYKNKVLKLTRIVATPCYNWFLTAAFGKTSSAKPLIETIKDKNQEHRLPIASILFDKKDVEVSRLTDDEIVNQIKNVCATN